MCRVIRLQLVGLGYPVIEADHSADALQLLASVPTVGILVSDLVMPGGMDGQALCSVARQRSPHARPWLISGYARRRCRTRRRTHRGLPVEKAVYRHRVAASA